MTHPTATRGNFRSTARSLLRHGTLSALGAWYGLSGKSARLGTRPVVQIALLHHVVDDEQDSFRTLLLRLSEIYRFVSYTEAVDRIESGVIEQPCLAFSFDDGLKNNLPTAAILNEFGAKACFFVCPQIVGQKDPTVKRQFAQSRLEMPAADFMNWNDLVKLLALGHEIGSHTMNHVLMRQTAPADLQDELQSSRDALQRRVGPVPHFAWPYGRFFHIHPAAVREVFKAGYTSCASGERGSHAPHRRPGTGRVCIRRDSIEAGWPMSHIMYFFARSAEMAFMPDETWPEDWPAEIGGAAAWGETKSLPPRPVTIARRAAG